MAMHERGTRVPNTPGQWKAFVAALERPAQVKPRLRRLFSEPSVLERQHS
jgi:uncharacterized protein (DUF1778 family)